MPDKPSPGKEPFGQRVSTTAGKDMRRPGPVRIGAPVLESVARRAEEDARAAGPGDGVGFRSALLRARSEASDGPGSNDRPIPSPLRPRPTVAASEPADEEDDPGLRNWQANEIRWLNTKVGDLERRLRRRKIISMGAVAFGGLALIGAVALGIGSPQGPEALVADIETTSSGGTPDAARPVAGEPAQAPEAAPPAPREPAETQAWMDEQASGAPPPLERLPTGTASTAGEPGRGVETRTSTITPAPDAAAPATDAPGQNTEPWQLEAERALTALIEHTAPSGTPEEPERAMEIPELLPREGPATSLDARGAGETLETAGRLEADPEGLAEGAAEDVRPYAATASVNLRDGPSTEADVLTVVGEGERVRRLGGEGDWLLVEYGDPGGEIVTGWVHGRFLRRVESSPSARSGG
jgi:hypothetical protein